MDAALGVVTPTSGDMVITICQHFRWIRSVACVCGYNSTEYSRLNLADLLTYTGNSISEVAIIGSDTRILVNEFPMDIPRCGVLHIPVHMLPRLNVLWWNGEQYRFSNNAFDFTLRHDKCHRYTSQSALRQLCMEHSFLCTVQVRHCCPPPSVDPYIVGRASHLRWIKPKCHATTEYFF